MVLAAGGPVVISTASVWMAARTVVVGIALLLSLVLVGLGGGPTSPPSAAPTTGRVLGYVQMDVEPLPYGGFAVTLGGGPWKLFLVNGSVIGRLHMAVQAEKGAMGPLVPMIVGPDD